MTKETISTKIITIKTISTSAFQTNFNGKNVSCKIETFYFLHFIHIFIITISLLIFVSIYCYLIKHQSKQKQLLLNQGTSNNLKGIDINNIFKNK